MDLVCLSFINCIAINIYKYINVYIHICIYNIITCIYIYIPIYTYILQILYIHYNIICIYIYIYIYIYTEFRLKIVSSKLGNSRSESWTENWIGIELMAWKFSWFEHLDVIQLSWGQVPVWLILYSYFWNSVSGENHKYITLYLKVHALLQCWVKCMIHNQTYDINYLNYINFIKYYSVRVCRSKDDVNSELY